MKNNTRSKGRRKRKNNGTALSLGGPPGLEARGRMRCPPQPPIFNSNLTVRKTFRFINTNTSDADGTSFTIIPAKLGFLMAYATTSTNLVQLFESVRILSISIWSSVSNVTNVNVQPRSVAIQFSGVTLGIGGVQLTHSDTSVGMTRIARVKARPEPSSQAGQWQSCTNAATPSFFNLLIGSGAVVDLDLLLNITSDARSGNNATLTGPATVGQIYYLALDNAMGGGSNGNHLTPPPELITIT